MVPGIILYNHRVSSLWPLQSRHDGIPWRGSIHQGESSLVPGFPLRSALISLSVISWIVFDVLHSFGKKLPRLQYSCRVHKTHAHVHTCSHTQAVFSLPIEDTLFGILVSKLYHKLRNFEIVLRWQSLLLPVSTVGNSPHWAILQVLLLGFNKSLLQGMYLDQPWKTPW